MKAVPQPGKLFLISGISINCQSWSGQVLRDLIAVRSHPSGVSTEGVRQAAFKAESSPWLTASQGGTSRLWPSPTARAIIILSRQTNLAGSGRFLELVQQRIPNALTLIPFAIFKFLCPMNRGGLGARSLNLRLQKALNPPRQEKIEKFGSTFAPKDKVMQDRE